MYLGAARTLWYGPFPVRLGRVFGGFAALAVALLMGVLGLERQELRCDFRDGGECRLETFVSQTPNARFWSSDLREASVTTVRRGKGKGTLYGKLVLRVGAGQLSLMEIDPDEANALLRRLEAARHDGTQFSAELEGTRWLLVFSVAILAMSASLFWVAVRRMGRLRLTIPGDGTLRVERLVLGVPLGARTHSLYGVREVGVEFGTESDMWNRRGEEPRKTGRLLLYGSSGPVPLTPEYWPGFTLHLAAAAELRQALGLAPGRLETELAAARASREESPLARSLGGRIAIAWAGLCCGGLAGLALFGVLGLALGLLRPSDGIEPWMLIVGCGGGAIGGVLFAFWVTRPRVPR